MTKFPNQQLVLEQLQRVLRQLAEGESAGALDALVEVREAGLVNKELDAHINRLREEPAQSIPNLLEWLEVIVGRLQAFQGDFVQLVGEFSEAQVGLSEAEWSFPEFHGGAPDGGDDFFDGVDFDDLDEIDGFGDFDESEFDFDLPIADNLAVVEEIAEDASAGLFDDIEAIEAASRPLDDLDFPDFGGGEDSAVGAQDSKPFWRGFDDADEGSPEPERAESQSVDFALIESSPAIDGPDAEASRASDMRETARFPVVDDPQAGAPGGLEPQDFDFLDEIDAAVRRSEDALHAETAPRLSFEDLDAEDDEDDFDFGFENPEEKNKKLNRVFDADSTGLFDPPVELEDDLRAPNPAPSAGVGQAASTQEGSGEWGQGFDFGFDEDELDELEDEALSPWRPGEDDATSQTPDIPAASAPSEALPAPRELEITPPSMPAIPRFAAPQEPASHHNENQERTSPGDNEVDVEELRTRASLDDDEFFELAESLAGDSSAPAIPAPTKPKTNSYRGEPLMVEPRQRTPTPRVTPKAPEVTDDGFGGYTRQPARNPFAHQAPTGVRDAILGSNSSFVLEEISASEPYEDEAPSDTLLAEALRLFEQGELESARDLLSALLAGEEVSDQAYELVAAVDAELEAVYQARVAPLNRTPELNIAMSEVASMTLDHRFGFLLSQIDGMSSFEDILELSSMSRLETLDVLAQMLEREIIRVD